MAAPRWTSELGVAVTPRLQSSSNYTSLWCNHSRLESVLTHLLPCPISSLFYSSSTDFGLGLSTNVYLSRMLEMLFACPKCSSWITWLRFRHLDADENKTTQVKHDWKYFLVDRWQLLGVTVLHQLERWPVKYSTRESIAGVSDSRVPCLCPEIRGTLLIQEACNWLNFALLQHYRSPVISHNRVGMGIGEPFLVKLQKPRTLLWVRNPLW